MSETNSLDSLEPATLASQVLPALGGMERILTPTKPVLSSADKVAFSAIIEGAAANPDLCVISNRYPWQARIAAHKLLQIAREQKLPIRILSGRCHEGFYDTDFAKQLEACKESGCSIKVLVWQKTPEFVSSDLIRLAEAGTIDLRLSETDDFESTVPHFMLIGDFAFRQEAGHPPFSKNTLFSDVEPQVPARIDFHDPTTGKVLCGMFDSLWGAA